MSKLTTKEYKYKEIFDAIDLIENYLNTPSKHNALINNYIRSYADSWSKAFMFGMKFIQEKKDD